MGRRSGILMHISSLPSQFGIGDFGRAAYDFVDFLHISRQKFWQILPVGPTIIGDSPYQSPSAFAGNPYFIDFNQLASEGLLENEDFVNIDWGSDQRRVDFGKIYEKRFVVLKKAFENFGKTDSENFSNFKLKHASWLPNFCLYMAVKEQFGNTPWTHWPDEKIKFYEPKAVECYREKLAEKVRFWEFLQWKFFEQWESLKWYAHTKNVEIIGDLPIYVALDSADVWANRKLFWLNGDEPACVAGCPPDDFSGGGQLWGNPLYDWEAMRADEYAWWAERMAHAAELFDVTRIDHFRGFDAYYAVPWGSPDATNGRWLPGPGMPFFRKIQQNSSDYRIIAEDLGFMTESVRALLRETGFPGMKILQRAFDGGPENPFLPHNFTKNCVVYTGTHDNDTTAGWFAKLPLAAKEHVKNYASCSPLSSPCWEIIRLGLASVADTAITPMQDFLNLPTKDRMNTPSTLWGNWQWRALAPDFSDDLARKIANLTELYGRA